MYAPSNYYFLNHSEEERTSCCDYLPTIIVLHTIIHLDPPSSHDAFRGILAIFVDECLNAFAEFTRKFTDAQQLKPSVTVMYEVTAVYSMTVFEGTTPT